MNRPLPKADSRSGIRENSAVPSAPSADERFGRIVEELTNRVHRGEPVELREYVEKYPQFAEKLEHLLPALTALADLASCASDGSAPATGGGDLLTGQLGDFRILREIGRGGMGVVYEAEQISLARRVALKVLPFAAMLDERALKRFKIEAQAAALIDHPNIVDIYGVGCERGVHYYAMRLIDGQTLAEVIAELENRQTGRVGETDDQRSCTDEREHPNQCPTVACAADRTTSNPDSDQLTHLPTGKSVYRRVAEWGIDIATALDHAHEQGVIHRDIKPSNLILDSRGKIWVTDLGLAHIESASHTMTRTGDLLGTLRYMSPEQLGTTPGGVDHRTDIYSLGATLYELLALQPAYPETDRARLLRSVLETSPQPPRRLRADVPHELETIVLKCLSKEPAGRYAAAREVAEDLQRYLEGHPIRARRPTLLEVAMKWSHRHRRIIRLVAGTLVATMLLSSWFIWRERVDALHQRDLANAHRRRSEQNLRHSLGTVLGLVYAIDTEGDATKHHSLVARRAQELFESFVDEEADDPLVLRDAAAAHLNLAYLHFLRRDLLASERSFEGAIRVWNRLSREFPHDEDYAHELAIAYDQLGQLLMAAGDQERATDVLRHTEGMYRRLIANDVRRFDHLERLAWLLAAGPAPLLRQPKEAVRLAMEAVELGTQSGIHPGKMQNALGTLGVAYFRCGELDKAEDAVRRAIECQPETGHVPELVFLAMVFSQTGRREEGTRHFCDAARRITQVSRHQELSMMPLLLEAAQLLEIDEAELAALTRQGRIPRSAEIEPPSAAEYQNK